jgi:phosphate transport system permease protein
MPSLLLVGIIVALIVLGYVMGRQRAVATVSGDARHLHSLPSYYGAYVALWCGVPALLLVAGWLIAKPQLAEWALVAALDPQTLTQLSGSEIGLMVNNIVNLATGNIVSGEPTAEMIRAAEAYQGMARISQIAMSVVALALAILGIVLGRRYISPQLRARNTVERFVSIVMIIASLIAILTTAGIVLSLLFESLRFFQKVPLHEFLFGLSWSPQTALRADQVGSSGAFGAVPIFMGTAVITMIAMLVAVPIGLFSAIYMSEYAGPKVRATAKPILEVLAGVPTVVYGFFAALTVAPFFRGFGEGLGLLPFRRRDERGAAELARRRLCAGGNQVGDHQAGDRARGPAGHRRLGPAGGQPRHWRDHDRGDGRRPCRQSHGQPLAGGDHGDGADRDPADRRPGVRQRQDPGRLRAGPRALPGHADAQHRGPAGRPEVQGKV